MPTPKPTAPRRLLVAAAMAVTLAGPLACRHTDGVAYSLPGQVVDETGAPVAGAQLKIGTHVATADAAGKFTTPVIGEPNDTVALAVSAAGYAGRTLRLTVLDGSPPSLAVVLRPIGTTATVTLPGAGEPPAVVTLARADSSTQLSIAAGSLVTAAGAPAAGAVTVTMTYWQPGEPMLSAPGPLAGIAAVGAPVVPLHSAGMLDVHIVQGGAELQVAPGAGLPWQVTLGAASKAFYAANVPALQQMSLWSLDANQAAFVSPSAPGAIAVDPNGATLTANLTHLSCWNYDYNCASQNVGGNCMTTDNGGCVRGIAHTCSGAPLANAQVRLWAMGYGSPFAGNQGVKDFVVATDANGQYCAVLGTEIVRDGGSDTTVAVHVSGVAGPTLSNLACPLTGHCQQCDQEPTFCNTCANGTPSGTSDPNARSYVIHNGDFCPSDACTALPDVYIGAQCAGIGTCPASPLPEGAPCDARMPATLNNCCAANLTCSDGVCVPAIAPPGGY